MVAGFLKKISGKGQRSKADAAVDAAMGKPAPAAKKPAASAAKSRTSPKAKR